MQARGPGWEEWQVHLPLPECRRARFSLLRPEPPADILPPNRGPRANPGFGRSTFPRGSPVATHSGQGGIPAHVLLSAVARVRRRATTSVTTTCVCVYTHVHRGWGIRWVRQDPTREVGAEGVQGSLCSLPLCSSSVKLEITPKQKILF